MNVVTEVWVPIEGNKGIYQKRKAKEVFDDLCKVLKKEELLPDEYFLLDMKPDELYPEVCSMYCYAEWGSSEGIYLNIKIFSYDDEEKTYKNISFATGKTLKETTDAFNCMQYIAGYIYLLLMGGGQIHPRYMRIAKNPLEKERELLLDKLNSDASDLIKKKLYKLEGSLDMYAEELAMKLMILYTLVKNDLPEEIVHTLLMQSDILETLSTMCKPIMKANYHEIEDVLVSAINGGIINEQN